MEDENYLKIKKADNGAILIEQFEDEDSEGKNCLKNDTTLFEEDIKYEETYDSNYLNGILYKVAEYLGYSNDRYSNKNLSIKFDGEGSKYCPKE